MAKDPTILKFGDVVDRVRTYQTKMASEKTAGATKVPETDPNAKGTVSIPTDPEVSRSKQNMPMDNINTSSEGTKLEDQNTQPHSTGKYRIYPADGTMKDEAACGGDSTKPLSKIANRANSIMARLKSTCGTEPAAEEGAEEAMPAKATKMKQNAKEANTSTAQNIQADPEFLFKLASTILETEGGIEAVEPVLRKAAGVEAAQELITRATDAYYNLVQEGYEDLELQKQAMEQQAYVEATIGGMLKAASHAEREGIVKLAQVHDANINEIDHPILKQAYMQGAMDGAEMEDSMEGADSGVPLPPEAAMIPGAEDGPASPEQIIELLDGMVSAGEIDEETAMAVAQQLMTEGGDEPMYEEDMAAEDMPETGMVAEEPVKAAKQLMRELITYRN